MAAAAHAPPKGLVPVTPEPITKNNPTPDAGTPPKGLKRVTPVPLIKPNSGKRPPRRTHPAVGRNAPPKGLVYVTPEAITKNNPMPDAGSPPKGLKQVTPIPWPNRKAAAAPRQNGYEAEAPQRRRGPWRNPTRFRSRSTVQNRAANRHVANTGQTVNREKARTGSFGIFPAKI